MAKQRISYVDPATITDAAMLEELERCRREDPPLLDLGNGHESACWRAPLTEETAAE